VSPVVSLDSQQGGTTRLSGLITALSTNVASLPFIDNQQGVIVGDIH